MTGLGGRAFLLTLWGWDEGEREGSRVMAVFLEGEMGMVMPFIETDLCWGGGSRDKDV